MAQRARVGVCLSGGGHRATLFGLGSLKYLIDAGIGPDITVVSSVSGGSLANGWVALDVDLTTVDRERFEATVSSLAGRIARRGTLWATWTTYAFLAVAASPVVVAVLLALRWRDWRAAAVIAASIVASAWIGAQRSLAARVAFDRTLFRGRTLGELHSSVDHVICSTDLQTCEPVYFTRDFVYSWRTGFGPTSSLSIATAVQCSAALPGAFAPISLPTRPHVESPSRPLRRFLLSDGGVYDNMATEWAQTVRRRRTEAAACGRTVRDVDTLIVVNASAAKGVNERRLARVPLVGEVVSLLAAKDVLYDQSTAVRRRWLFSRSLVARSAPRLRSVALRSAQVQIDRSPLELPERFAAGDDDRARRARAVRDLLGADAQAWADGAAANAKVATTLSAVEPHVAARLLRHAYVLTMVNCHVLLGFPLLAVPTRQDAGRWIAPTPSALRPAAIGGSH